MTKRLLVVLQTCLLYLVSCSLPSIASAWVGDVGDVATIKSAESLFTNILANAIRFVGLATFVMILVGGFKYLTSGGDPKATEMAQQTMTMGIIGLVLAIAGWFILSAISGFTGNPSILNFTVGLP